MSPENRSNGAFPGPTPKVRGVFGTGVLTSPLTASSALYQQPQTWNSLLSQHSGIIFFLLLLLTQKSSILLSRVKQLISCSMPPSGDLLKMPPGDKTPVLLAAKGEGSLCRPVFLCGNNTHVGILLVWCFLHRLLAIPLFKVQRKQDWIIWGQVPWKYCQPFVFLSFSLIALRVMHETQMHIAVSFVGSVQLAVSSLFTLSTLKIPLSSNLESNAPCKNLSIFTLELTSVSYLKGTQDANILT